MKCPECVKEGKRSRVFVGGSFTTLMGFYPYYDDDGEYHSHDPNKKTTQFSCGNGHVWSKSHYTPCPTCGEVRK